MIEYYSDRNFTSENAFVPSRAPPETSDVLNYYYGLPNSRSSQDIGITALPAVALDPSPRVAELSAAKSKRRRRLRLLALGMMILLLVLVAVIVGVYVSVHRSHHAGTKDVKSTQRPQVTTQPTMASYTGSLPTSTTLDTQTSTSAANRMLSTTVMTQYTTMNTLTTSITIPLSPVPHLETRAT